MGRGAGESELDHLIRPLAQELKVEHLLTNRLEFRDGRATGRLLDPVVGSLGGAALSPEERGETWLGKHPHTASRKMARTPDRSDFPSARQHSVPKHAVVDFGSQPYRVERLSVRKALGERPACDRDNRFHWQSLANHAPQDLPEIGRIYLGSAPRLAFCATAF
jgi:hypothetical protein